MPWSRNTLWRQGHLLPLEALAGLSLQADYAMVITHDCDLANDRLDVEPYVEVLLGKVGQPSERSELTWGKAPRRIQLEFSHPSQPSLWLEFNIIERKNLSKNDLCNFEPQAYRLKDQHHHALREWLANRYRRSAFPDEFEQALSGTKLRDKLKAELKKAPAKDITGVLFGYQLKQDDEGPYYSLEIVLLCKVDRDADQVANSINQWVQSKGNPLPSQSGTRILIEGCKAISEDDMLFSRYRQLHKWNLDHISLNQDPPGEILD